jgi:hypothetical protein
MIAALTALATMTASSCQPAEPAAEPGDVISYPAELPTPEGPEDPFNRWAVAPVPAGLTVKAVEFPDADRGYALFERCATNEPCQVALAVSLDGGLSWLSRKLPFDNAVQTMMAVGRGNVLLLRAQPHGWYISRDSGRTFQPRPLDPPPVELALAGPQFVYRCADGSTSCAQPVVMEIMADGTGKAVPAPAPIPADARDVQLVLGGDGRLWMAYAATRNAAKVVTLAVGTNRGSSWSEVGAAAFNTPTNAGPFLAVSSDGAGVWLLAGGAGFRVGDTGALEDVSGIRGLPQITSAVAISKDRAVVSTDNNGSWYLRPTTTQRGAPRDMNLVKPLGGGVMFGYTSNAGERYLCQSTVEPVRWAKITVTAPRG